MSEKSADERLRLSFAKILDVANAARKNHSVEWSDFLDPVQADKFYRLLSKERDINTMCFGGYALAERKMLGCCTDYLEIAEQDFPIDVLDITYDSRFNRELVHRDFLGSILALGIDRSRVGDIVVDNGVAHVFICRGISEYTIANLERVGRAKVNIFQGTAENLQTPEGRELKLTVASLRLDAVISAAFNISRGKSADLITGEKVFVNWALQKSASAPIGEGDMVTVRGTGRVRLVEVGGRTRKDRVVIRVERF